TPAVFVVSTEKPPGNAASEPALGGLKYAPFMVSVPDSGAPFASVTTGPAGTVAVAGTPLAGSVALSCIWATTPPVGLADPTALAVAIPVAGRPRFVIRSWNVAGTEVMASGRLLGTKPSP